MTRVSSLKSAVSFLVSCLISLRLFSGLFELRLELLGRLFELRLELLGRLFELRLELLGRLFYEFAGFDVVAVLEPDGGDQQRSERGEHHPESRAEDRQHLCPSPFPPSSPCDEPTPALSTVQPETT